MGLPAQAYFPSLAELTTNFGTLHSDRHRSGVNLSEAVQFTPADNSTVRANTAAVYLMGSFRTTPLHLPFNGNIGVRVVYDEDKSAAICCSRLYPGRHHAD